MTERGLESILWTNRLPYPFAYLSSSLEATKPNDRSNGYWMNDYVTKRDSKDIFYPYCVNDTSWIEYSPMIGPVSKRGKFNGKSQKSDKCHLILDLLSRRTDKSSGAYDSKLFDIGSTSYRWIPSSTPWLLEDETMNALKYRNYTKMIKKPRILWSKWRNHRRYSQNWNVRYHCMNPKKVQIAI